MLLSDRAPDRDPPARGSEPVPAGAGGEGRGRPGPPPHLVRAPGSRAPHARSARRDGAGTRAAVAHRDAGRMGPPAPTRAPRRRPGARPRPSIVGPGALDRDLAVGPGGPSEGDRRVRARPCRARGPVQRRRSAPGRGRQRLLARVTARIAEAHGAGPVLHPGRGPAPADRLDQRHERQDDHDAADRAHPARGRQARRHDDLGRHRRQRRDGRAGRLDGLRRGAPDPDPRRRRHRGARDRPRRDPPSRDRLRVERGERGHERLVGPPRPPGHPHAARARRGQVDHRADHEAERLGRAERRRQARLGRGAQVRGKVAFFTHGGRRVDAGAPPPARRWAGVPRPRRRPRRGRGRSMAAPRESRRRAGRARRDRSPQRRECPRGGGRRTRDGRDARAGGRRAALLPPDAGGLPRPPQRVPGCITGRDRRLRPQRSRGGGPDRRRRGDRGLARARQERRQGRACARDVHRRACRRPARRHAPRRGPAGRIAHGPVRPEGDAPLPPRPDAGVRARRDSRAAPPRAAGPARSRSTSTSRRPWPASWTEPSTRPSRR